MNLEGIQFQSLTGGWKYIVSFCHSSEYLIFHIINVFIIETNAEKVSKEAPQMYLSRNFAAEDIREMRSCLRVNMR